MPVASSENVATNLRQLSHNMRNLGLSVRDAVKNNALVDNLKEFRSSVSANVKDFGENIRNNIDNSRNPAFGGRAATRRWSAQHSYGEVFKIRSVRKLLDVIERRYSYISITLLLISTALETTAVVFFLLAQYRTSLNDWRKFEWGMANFVIISVMSLFFAVIWVTLLATEDKKFSYLFKATSIMTYLTSFWMLVLASAAIVTQDRSWTRVYAPMFFRVWWLHECLLSLLDYPQISSFFTANKLEMLRSFVQCMAVLAISVGLLQAVEIFCGDHMEYFNTLYMMIIVFSTIGFGDVTVSTVPGRLLMIVLIGVGISYFIPMLEYIANLGVQHLRYASYGAWLKRADHLVFCGRFGHSDLHMQLENAFAGKRKYYNMHIVVMLPDQPSADILLLLNSPKYRSTVTLLVGDPGNANDLVRCNVRGASAIFLFGRGATSSYYDDYDVARQAMEVHEQVPNVPMFVLLHRSRYTRSIMPKSARIIEIERLTHNLLGLGCVLPGMIPFIANLVRVFEPMDAVNLWKDSDFADPGRGTLAVARAFTQIAARQREMFSYEALLTGTAPTMGSSGAADDVTIERDDIASFDPLWCDLYEASLAQHIEIVALPADQRPRSFRSLATLLYKEGITTIGVVRRVTPTTARSGPASPTARRPSSPACGNPSFASFTGATATSGLSFAIPSPLPQDHLVELAPRGTMMDVDKVILICNNRKTAETAIETLPPVEMDREMQGFDDRDALQALREHIVKRGVAPMPTHRGKLAASLQPHSFCSQAPAPPEKAPLSPVHATDVVVVGETVSSSPVGPRSEGGTAASASVSPAAGSPTLPPALRKERDVADGHSDPSSPHSSTGGLLRPVKKAVLILPPDGTPTTVDDAAPTTATGQSLALEPRAPAALLREGSPPPPALRQSFSCASLGSETSASRAALPRRGSTHSLSNAEERGKAVKIVANADHLNHHFIFIDLSASLERSPQSNEATSEAALAKAADFFDVLRPARQHSPINQIVLLASEPNYDYLSMMWEDEMSGSLAVIQGCGLFLSDLQRCNLRTAAAVVVFSAGERCDEHGDSLTILVSKTIRKLAQEARDPSAPELPVVLELDETTYVPLAGEGTMDRDDLQAADWVMDPSFLSGRVVCRHMLDTGLQEAFFVPEVQQVIEQLLSGWGDTLSVTSVSAHATWTTYGEAIDYCVERRLLPLALHRLHEDLVASFRFIVTNPPPPFPIVSSDVIYCLKIH